MDPVRQMATPIAEVRAQAPASVDEFGEQWIMLDGVETKVPDIKMARKLLAQQDAVRIQIREDLDALGVRDRTELVEITLDDGTKTTIEMLPPGDHGANILQIGGFPDAKGLFENAEKAQYTLHVDTAYTHAHEARVLAEHSQNIAERAMRKVKRWLGIR
jgi:hypothetical protein